MKKIVPIILILFISGMSIFNYFNSKNTKVTVPEIDLPDEMKDVVIDKAFEDGNMENSGGASTIYVENIDIINQFLDIDMMLKYKDLVTSYGLLLPNIITNDVEQYYNDNKSFIADTFGIYSASEFSNFYKVVEEVKKDDVLSGITINEIIQDGNLLKADVTYIYGDKEITIKHFINYVYINGQPQLFIYN